MVLPWQIQSWRNEIENETAKLGLQQIIKKPAHISNTSSSCIDLIFTSQPNLITDSGVHSSLQTNCLFVNFTLHKIIVCDDNNSNLIYCLQFLQECLGTSNEYSKERYYARIVNRLNTEKAAKLTGLC